nr:E3 ubiquitin-protein ligase TRIM33-like [Lytechinus pictus]
MATLEHTVSRGLQCPVCLSLLNDPKQLSCTHTFCQKCIRDIIACSLQNNNLTCPLCRIKTNVADGNVANLKTNVPVKSLVDDVRNSKQLCDMCDEQSRAAHFCCDCGKNMCNACLQAHNTWKPHLKHKVVSVEDIREGRVVLKKKIYCQEEVHQSEEYECSDVCTTCKKLICMRCRMLYHEKTGHDVKDLREYNSSFKKSSELLQGQGKTKATTVKNHMTCIDNQIKRVNDHIDAENAKLDKLCEDAIKKIKERNATLKKQLEDQREELCKSLNDMNIDDKRLVKSIESASDLLSNTLKAPLEGDVVAIRDSLSGELKNVLDRDDPKEKVAIGVGDHAEELTFTPSCDPETLSMGILRFVKCEPECNVKLSKQDSMNGMATSTNGIVAVGSQFGGIEIYSADGQLQKTVIKDLWIREVGFLSDSRYVVLDTNNKMSLYTSDEEKQDASFDTLDDSEGGFGGLSVDSNGLIYVSYRKAKKIQIFLTSGGKAIREIPCDGYEPSNITSYGDTLIVKQFSNTIIRIDKKGCVMHELTEPGENDLHAAVSKDNTILIASVRRSEGLLNIDEYTGELKHIKTLISYYKIGKTERRWYHLRQFQSGEIAFCTPDRLYIFNLVTCLTRCI